jgi:hypothetical protein
LLHCAVEAPRNQYFTRIAVILGRTAIYQVRLLKRTSKIHTWNREMAMPNRPRSGSRKPALQERQDAAAALAITALSFIAGEPERLGRFLALTGIGPESIRTAAREPNFLVGVLDHLASDDQLLRAFAEQNDLDPEQVMQARELLAGGIPNGS